MIKDDQTKRMDTMRFALASVVDRMLKELGYAETQEILKREFKLVEVGKRAEELGMTDKVHFSFRPIEIAALRSILVNCAMQPDHVQVWQDIVSNDSVTLGELMSKLMPK